MHPFVIIEILYGIVYNNIWLLWKSQDFACMVVSSPA